MTTQDQSKIKIQTLPGLPRDILVFAPEGFLEALVLLPEPQRTKTAIRALEERRICILRFTDDHGHAQG